RGDEGEDRARRVAVPPGVGRARLEVRVDAVVVELTLGEVVRDVLAGSPELEVRDHGAAAGAEQQDRVVAGGDHGRLAARRAERRAARASDGDGAGERELDANRRIRR